MFAKLLSADDTSRNDVEVDLERFFVEEVVQKDQRSCLGGPHSVPEVSEPFT